MFKIVFSMYPPLILSLVVHMIIVKYDSMSFLNVPLSEKLFGRNKTWRGLILMPLLTSVAIYFFKFFFGISLYANSNSVLLGTALGLAYILGELPNSWVKRRLGILPGQTIEGKARGLQLLVDRLDSALACAIVFWWLLDEVHLVHVLLFVVFGIFIHLTFTFLLYHLKIRKNPF